MAKAPTTQAAKANEVQETPEQLIERHGGTKSNAIRAMAADGMKTGEIARKLNIRYQHARNVLARPLKTQAASESDANKQAAKRVEGAKQGR